MKKILLAVVLLCATSALADEPISIDSLYRLGWRQSLTIDASAAQTAYSDSWTGGEVGSVSWVANLNGSAERQMKLWFNYRTTLKLSFGQTLTQDEETGDWSKPKKSTDLIDWDNLGRFTVNAFVDPYAAFRLESQFRNVLAPGYTKPLSPLRLTESAGIAKKLFSRPKDDQVITRLGFAVRESFQHGLAVGVMPADTTIISTTLTDGGIESVTDASIVLRPNLKWVGKLTLFKALFFSEKDAVAGTPFEDDWKAVDANLENQVTAAITKVVTVSLYTQLLYDKQISYKGRFKETLGLGLAFKLF